MRAPPSRARRHDARCRRGARCRTPDKLRSSRLASSSRRSRRSTPRLKTIVADVYSSHAGQRAPGPPTKRSARRLSFTAELLLSIEGSRVVPRGSHTATQGRSSLLQAACSGQSSECGRSRHGRDPRGGDSTRRSPERGEPQRSPPKPRAVDAELRRPGRSREEHPPPHQRRGRRPASSSALSAARRRASACDAGGLQLSLLCETLQLGP